jgi:hypothetical protein
VTVVPPSLCVRVSTGKFGAVGSFTIRRPNIHKIIFGMIKSRRRWADPVICIEEEIN